MPQGFGSLAGMVDAADKFFAAERDCDDDDGSRYGAFPQALASAHKLSWVGDGVVHGQAVSDRRDDHNDAEVEELRAAIRELRIEADAGRAATMQLDIVMRERDETRDEVASLWEEAGKYPRQLTAVRAWLESKTKELVDLRGHASVMMKGVQVFFDEMAQAVGQKRKAVADPDGDDDAAPEM